MTPILVFDIETIPDIVGIKKIQNLSSSMSDKDVADYAFSEQYKKTGNYFLPHFLHRIIVISCVFRDEKKFEVHSLGLKTDSEENIIYLFYRIIEKYTPQLVSWNGSGFDLPVLHYRSLIHGVRALRYWETGNNNKDFKWNNYINRYHDRHIDLMDILALHQIRANSSLNNISKLCGFPGKVNIDGKDVWCFFQKGKIEEIRNYCETDVVNTYLLYCKFQLIRGFFSRSDYENEIFLIKEYLKRKNKEHWDIYLNEFN